MHTSQVIDTTTYLGLSSHGGHQSPDGEFTLRTTCRERKSTDGERKIATHSDQIGSCGVPPLVDGAAHVCGPCTDIHPSASNSRGLQIGRGGASETGTRESDGGQHTENRGGTATSPRSCRGHIMASHVEQGRSEHKQHNLEEADDQPGPYSFTQKCCAVIPP